MWCIIKNMEEHHGITYLVGLVLAGLVLGAAGGYYFGTGVGFERGIVAEKADATRRADDAAIKAAQEAAQSVNPFGEGVANPFEKNPANPFEQVTTNPFE